MSRRYLAALFAGGKFVAELSVSVAEATRNKVTYI